MITIYHNPRCSKSRETLALVESLNTAGAPLNVVEYLKTPPTVEELDTLHKQLGRPVRDMLRDGEEPYKALNLARADLTDAEAYGAIVAHPVLLQRPIVVYRGKAAIGRPPGRRFRRRPQQRDLSAIGAASAAGRQMHAHLQALVQRQTPIERIRQQSRHVSTFPRQHLRSSVLFRSGRFAGACAPDTAARCNDSSSTSIHCRCPRFRHRGIRAS